MKRVIFAMAVLLLASMTCLAQMGGHQPQPGQPGPQTHSGGGMMGTQQAQQAMGNQMMRNTMMREMSTMMKQMNGMMQTMSNTMEHGNMIDQTHMRDMSRTMNEMSDIMKEMAGRMAEGKMEPADMKKLQERMESTRHELDKMAKEQK